VKLDTHVHTVYSGYSTIKATTREEFLEGLRTLVASPADWRRHAAMACGLLALPLVGPALPEAA
jgi:hypothetical protein